MQYTPTIYYKWKYGICKAILLHFPPVLGRKTKKGSCSLLCNEAASGKISKDS